MTDDDDLVRRHESGHVSACLLMKRRVRRVRVYGEHGVLVGHGYTDSVPREDETPAERLVPLLAGIMYEPTHSGGDVRSVERLERSGVPGMRAAIEEATALANKMVAAPEFKHLAVAVELALWYKPDLDEPDVLALTA